MSHAPLTTNPKTAWGVFVAGAALTLLTTTLLARWFQLGPVDDAFISLRYAHNWATGQGLVFNPGEVVEGYTNFLLVALEAALIRAGMDGVMAMQAIGWVALATLGGLLGVFAYQHIFVGRAPIAVVLATLMVINPMLFCWGASGMESCLAATLVLGAVLTLLNSRRAAGLVGSAGLLVLAAMTRPELVLLFPVLTLVTVARCRRWQPAAIYAGVLALAFGVYFVVRALHFGYLFPNTFYAKLDYGGWLLACRGGLYVLAFLLANLPLVVLSIGGVVMIRRAPLWAWAAFGILLVQMAAAIYMGGDHFALWRFLVPALPWLMLLALVPAMKVVAAHGWRKAGSLTAVAITLVALLAADLLVATQHKRDEDAPISHLQRFVLECHLARQWSAMGRWFAAHTPPDESIATIAIGAIGYYSDMPIVDPLGLIDLEIAHRQQQLGTGQPGHEKYDVELVLQREPGYILLVNVLTPTPVPLKAVSSMNLPAFPAQLSQHPDLYADYRYESVPLDQSRRAWLNVFVRRDLEPLSGD